MRIQSFWASFKDDVPNQGLWQFQFENPNYGSSGDDIGMVDAMTEKALTHRERFEQGKAFGLGLLKSWKWKRGDVLFICANPHIDMPSITAGVHYASGTVAMSDPDQDAAEIAYQLKECGARAIVASSAIIKEVNAAARVAGLPAEFVLTVETGGSPDVRSWRDISSEDEAGLSPDPVDPKKDAAYIMFTPGQTGPPKGCKISHWAWIAQLMSTSATNKPFKGNKRERIMGLPQHTVAGLQARDYILYDGSCMIVVSDFSMMGVLKTIETFKINWTLLPPQFLEALVYSSTSDKFDLSSLVWVGTRGASFPEWVSKAIWHRYGIRIRNHYGMTELCGQVSAQSILESLTTHGTSGSLSPGIRAKLLDEQGRHVVGEGIPGRLWVRTPCRMMGYTRDPDPRLQCFGKFDKRGYFDTGDIVSIRDGLLTVHGRFWDQIRCNGKIYVTTQMERVLREHNKVKDCVVVTTPGCEGYEGQAPYAFVVLKSRQSLSSKELCADLSRHVEEACGEAVFTVDRIKIIPEIPRTLSGKLRRQALMQMANLDDKDVAGEPGALYQRMATGSGTARV